LSKPTFAGASSGDGLAPIPAVTVSKIRPLEPSQNRRFKSTLDSFYPWMKNGDRVNRL
jgi:hypothetical protein